MLQDKDPNGFVFAKNSDAVVESMQFLEWVHSTQENYELIQYGELDTNYQIIDDKLLFPRDSTALSLNHWMGSNGFNDITLKRSVVNEYDDDSYSFVSRLKLNNTISEAMYLDLGGTDITTINKNMQENAQEIESVINDIYSLYSLYDDVYSDFAYGLNAGEFSMDIEEVINMLSEANSTEIEALLNERNGLIYDE